MKTSTQGYRTNSPDNKEKALLIPSNNISMKDTIHEEIYAVPFKNGKAQKMVLMKKGGQYQFDDADYVIEIPAPRIPQMPFGGGVDMLGRTTDETDPLNFWRTATSGNEVNFPQQKIDPMLGGSEAAPQNPFFPSQFKNGTADMLGRTQEELLQNPATQNNVGAATGENPATQNNVVAATGANPATQNNVGAATEEIDEQKLSENISDFGKTYGGGDSSKLDLKKDERDRLYNPYATYDTRAAAHTLGRAIGGQENVGTGIAAGAKVGLSIFRDTMSGFGSANREGYAQRQYEENQRKDMVRNYAPEPPKQQTGGEISYEDVMKIREQTGINFDEDFAKTFFEREPEAKNTAETQSIDLGRYKDVGYFSVAGKQGDTTILHTTDRNPHNADTVKQLERELVKLNPNQRLTVKHIPKKQRGGDISSDDFLKELKRLDQPQNYVSTNPPSAIQPQLPPREEYIRQLLKQFNEGQKTTEDILNEITPKGPINKMQAGGELSFAEKMTGEYEQGLPEGKEDQAVVEVEQGEHIMQPDGTISEAVGEKHSKGGVKLSAEQIQDGSIVISDHLKIGKENAEYFKQKYSVKVKPTDTYATVVDKVKKEIGIDKLIQEQEDVFKKIEKEEKNTKDETTKNLNLEYLSKKVKEFEDKKAAVEPQRIEAMQDVYEKQEASKPIEEQAQQEDQGVSPELLQQLSQESGMPVEQLQEFLKGGKVKRYKDGGFAEFLEFMGEDTNGYYTGDKMEEAIAKNPEWAKYRDENFELIGSGRTGDNYRLKEASGAETVAQNNVVAANPAIQNTAGGIGTIQLSQEDILGATNGADFKMQDLNSNGYYLDEEGNTQFGGVEDPEKKATERDFPLFPDQGVLPPGSIQPPLKSQIRLGRADSVNVSPEASHVELARQRQAAMGALDTLPPAQRAAMIAMLSTQEGQQASQAINQTAVANAQQDAQTQQFNIGQADREEALEAQNALSYEDRMFKTQAVYRENLNQYYDFLRKTNAQNFSDVRNQNTVNTLFEGYQIQPDGTLKYVGDSTSVVGRK